MTGYDLSRNWFDWCFENPDKITPTHTAMYFFIIEHCNRLGWKEKFGLPMEMTKDAIGIKNYRTYSKVFKDLLEWKFIKLIQKSKNQYSSNIIAIVENTKAHTKALDKAMQKQSQKQCNSIVGINKQEEHVTNNPITKEFIFIDEKIKLAWEKWKEFKKSQFNFSYKNSNSEQIAINELIQLCKNNFNNADKIVNNSIAKGYKGLFEIKEAPFDHKKVATEEEHLTSKW